MLAWSLGLLELPPDDELIDPGVVNKAFASPDAGLTRAVAAGAELKPVNQLDTPTKRLFIAHWRLREFSRRQRAIDFTEFARTAWFGPFDLAGVRLIDHDLAIGEHRPAEADATRVRATTSAVTERHLAANWLRDGGVHSNTDIST